MDVNTSLPRRTFAPPHPIPGAQQLPAGRRHPTTRHAQGVAPDLMVDILIVHTGRRDRLVK